MLLAGNLVLMVFGCISVLLVSGDIRHFVALRGTRPVPPTAWLRRHIGFMMGAYIATFTAFLVTNGPSGYGLSVWLGPTLVGVPLLLYWGRKYSRKPPAAVALRAE
jgi:phosphatidylglycerophosphate synthase